MPLKDSHRQFVWLGKEAGMRRSAWFVVGAVVGLLVAGSVAWAVVPSSNGVINACYQKKSGALRVIDAENGETCARSEVPLAWNQQGPQGPAGPQGPQGDPGERSALPAGTMTGFEVATGQDSWTTDAPQLVVSCPAGKVAIDARNQFRIYNPTTGQYYVPGNPAVNPWSENAWLYPMSGPEASASFQTGSWRAYFTDPDAVMERRWRVDCATISQ